jgi:Carboxypeptidase regulatory-like domain
MTSTTLRRLLLTLLFFFSPAHRLISQTLTSATVVGTVTDSSGAVVAGATVRIRQPETDAVRTATSGSSGEYRFPFLKPGEYEITAEATGLSSAKSRISLLVGQERAVNLTLGVQSVQQTVEIDTSSDLVQTENGNSVTSYNQQFIANTPVNGGDIMNIAFSTPGLRLNVGGGNTNFNVNGLPRFAKVFSRQKSSSNMVAGES